LIDVKKDNHCDLCYGYISDENGCSCGQYLPKDADDNKVTLIEVHTTFGVGVVDVRKENPEKE
jgi:hypothetical protein